MATQSNITVLLQNNVCRVNYLQRQLGEASKVAQYITEQTGTTQRHPSTTAEYREAVRKIKASLELLEENIG